MVSELLTLGAVVSGRSISPLLAKPSQKGARYARLFYCAALAQDLNKIHAESRKNQWCGLQAEMSGFQPAQVARVVPGF